MFSFTLTPCFFFIPNITAIFKNKVPPSSEPEMIQKKLENSHLRCESNAYFKIIAKYRWKVIFKHRQKLLFIS